MRLAFLSGSMKGDTVRLSAAEVTLGRSPEADVILGGDQMVSRLHCRLIPSLESWLVEDLGSANGTWLGKQRIHGRVPLELGATLVVGETRLSLIGDEQTIPSDSPPAEIAPAEFDPQPLVVTGSVDPRSLLPREVQEATTEIELLGRRLHALHQVSEALVGKLDATDVLRTVAGFLLTVVPARRAVALRRPAEDAAFVPVAVGHADPGDRDRIVLSSTLINRVARDRMAVLVGDTMTDAELSQRGSIQLGIIRSVICAPLIFQGELKAIIQLDTTAALSLNEEDLQLVTAVANQAAIAVANSDLYEELRQARARLERAEKLAVVGELATSVAHDIGNVLTPIAGLSIKVRQSPDIAPAIKDAFERGVRRLASLTRQLLALGRPRAAASALQPLDLNQVLQSSLGLLDTEARHAGVTIRPALATDLPAVAGDADRLDQVFVNLALNAIHAAGSRPAQPGELTVTTRRDGASVVVEFRDNGVGIAPEHLPRLFGAFFTTKGEHGTGLGLHSSKRIVEEEHHGALTVDSQLGRGTSFFVRLPVAG